MVMMIQRILKGEKVLNLQGLSTSEGMDLALREFSKIAMIFKIDNVAEYAYEVYDGKFLNIFDLCPNIAPSFVVMWHEYKSPKFANEDGRIVEIETRGRSGVLSLGVETDGGMEFFAELYKRSNFVGGRRIDIDAIKKEGKFFISSDCFVELENIVWAGRVHLAADKYGKPIGKLQTVPNKFLGRSLTLEEKEDLSDSIQQQVAVAFLAQSFAHCKNVTIEKDNYDLRLQKKHRKNGFPDIKINVVRINPLFETNRGKKQPGDQASPKIDLRLHIVRGHFKTFSDDKPLFGKLVGQYWWGQFMRGEKKHGEVVKGYEVESGVSIEKDAAS